MVPDTRYVRTGDVSIAYQVIDKGPMALVLVPGWDLRPDDNAAAAARKLLREKRAPNDFHRPLVYPSDDTDGAVLPRNRLPKR